MSGYKKTIVGATKAKAYEILGDVHNHISKDFDLRDNRVKNGVKAGGGQRDRRYFIDAYISYKNQRKLKVALTLLQDSENSEMVARVGRHDMGRAEPPEYTKFSMESFDKAIALYRSYLSNALSS